MSSELQFTRYLYVKEEVKLSLILCILNKKDEAIFWAYELYYSGFKSELINLFWCMYYDFYYTLNPSFEKYLQQKLKTNLVFEINCDNCDNCDNWLAMIVNNFMIRPHTMDIFMLKQIIQICDFDNPCIQEYKSSSNFTIINNELESILETQDFMILASLILTEIKDEHITEALKTVINYFNKKGLKLDSTKIINEYLKNLRNDYHSNNKRIIILSKIMHYFVLIKKIKLGKNIYVHIEPEEVIIYETINADLKAKDLRCILPAYKILPLATIYYIDKYNYLSLFHLKREKIDIKIAYREQWLYYAFFSPLWKERIIKHNGFINEINKKVMFLEKENSDDNEQAFYNEFGYEPDEQKIETQNKTIQDIKSERTWTSFYSEHKNSGIITIDDDILNDLSKVIYF